MPLVFGGAPIVNVADQRRSFIRPRTPMSPMLYVGFLLASDRRGDGDCYLQARPAWKPHRSRAMKKARFAVTFGVPLRSCAGLFRARNPPPKKLTRFSDAVAQGDAAAVESSSTRAWTSTLSSRYDRTALSFAADRGHVDVVKVLLERGADVTMKDTFYNATALTWAVSPAMDRKPQHTDVVRLLLRARRLSAEALKAALQAATRAKLTDVVALLEKAGAKLPPER